MTIDDSLNRVPAPVGNLIFQKGMEEAQVQDKLKEMEKRNPSLSERNGTVAYMEDLHVLGGVYDRVGTDFETNQPIYKPRNAFRLDSDLYKRFNQSVNM